MVTTRPPRAGLLARLSGAPRLALAVVLLVAGTLVALTAAAPPATAPVVVAVRDVAAGAVLVAADVHLVPRAKDTRPATALTDSAPVLGHRVIAGLARGEVLTSARIAPGGFTAGLGPGRAVAAVTVAAARAGVVAVGDVIRLVAALGPDTGDGASTTPTTLAGDARVLAVWVAPEGTPGGTPGGIEATATVVVDVDVGSASRLAVLPVDLLVGCVTVTA